jgi:hypothetical protein
MGATKMEVKVMIASRICAIAAIMIGLFINPWHE